MKTPKALYSMRKILNPYQKAKIAIAAIKENKTFAELSSEHQVHPSQISDWKRLLEKSTHIIFGSNRKNGAEEKIAKLEQMIGQREAEIEWLKKISHTLPFVKKS
jgi:transposase